MSFLANQRIRSKLLIALAPLALMVILAALYSSIESERIDTWYSILIDHEMTALQELTAAQAQANRFGLLLYRNIAELNPDKMRSTEADLDKAYADYRAFTAQALRQSTHRDQQIQAAQALFEQAVADSRPVRAAALNNQNDKAMQLMRGGVDSELKRSLAALVDLEKQILQSVNQQSDDLTDKTHHTILITWLVIVVGLIASFSLAFYIVQTEVVEELLALRGSIQEVANARFDQPIPFLDRENEIGEMSRAL